MTRRYVKRGAPHVVVSGATSLPAPGEASPPLLSGDAVLRARYAVEVLAGAPQAVSSGRLHAHVPGEDWALLPGDPLEGLSVELDEGRIVSFDVQGGGFDGYWLEADLATEAPVTVRVVPIEEY